MNRLLPDTVDLTKKSIVFVKSSSKTDAKAEVSSLKEKTTCERLKNSQMAAGTLREIMLKTWSKINNSLTIYRTILYSNTIFKLIT
jgi:hypothetical protein